MPIFSAVAASLAALAGTAGAGGTAAGLGAAGAAGGLGAAALGTAGTAAAGTAAAGGAAAATAGVGSAAAGGLGLAGTATTLGGIAGLAGVGLQGVGMLQQMSAQEKAQKTQEAAEQSRQNQMNFEAQRMIRSQVRQGVMARSVALTNATGQGAAQGSGLQGGYGQISGSVGNNITGTTAAQGAANAQFGFNQRLAGYNADEAMGKGLSSLGGALVQNQDAIGRFGTYLFS